MAVRFALSLVIAVIACPVAAFASDSTAVVITGKWVWDATGKNAIPNGVIVVQGDRITAIGTKDRVPVPDGAALIDRSELFLMPGLVNSHDHFSIDQYAGETMTEAEIFALPPPYLALRAAMNGRTSLRSGVTTVRIPGDVNFVDVQYKRAFEEDVVPGPRVVVAGRFIRPPEGFPTYKLYSLIDPAPSGVEEVRRYVRENIRAGVDFCKIFISGAGFQIEDDLSTIDANYMSKEEIETVVEECHRHNRKVTAHVIKNGPAFQWSLEAGVDAFEHGLALTEDDMLQIKEHGKYLVLAGARWLVPGGGWPALRPGPEAEQVLRNWYEAAAKARPLLALGVDGYHEPGAMVKELEILMKYAGFSNLEALQLATRNGGDLTGLPVGTLEQGKFADVIGVRGNPLEDISALRQVEFVMKGGKEYVLSER